MGARYPLRREDWGSLAYPEALERMRRLVSARIAGQIEDLLILCEHPPTITLGRSLGARGSLLSPGEVPVFEVERGGDASYHGPGQLVCYPILLLREGERDLHRYLRGLEETVIRVLGRFGLAGDRSGPTGVWLGGKKVASLGIAARRWVVFHGLSLNVSLDLSDYARIRPCGMDPSVMTSMAEVLGKKPPMDEVKEALCQEAKEILGRATG